MEEKKKLAKKLPAEPGCYIYKDKQGNIIYIGKAKNLKKRVDSYFYKKQSDIKTEQLKKRIADIDFIITDSESDALLLENNLIKENKPKYNIDLKDSRRYAYVEITQEKFPRVIIARKRTSKGEYYGPFISASAREDVLYLINRILGIRTCKKLPKRACLRYHIGLCLAPCIGLLDEEEYGSIIGIARDILKGKTKFLIRKLESKMKKASNSLEFEKAILLRNQIESLKYLNEKWIMERQKKYDEDVINYLIKDDKVYLIVFNVHNGTLYNKQEFIFDFSDDFFEEFLSRFYSDNPIPKEIIIPTKVSGAFNEFLSKKRKSQVRINVPKIGEKKGLLDLTAKNIELNFFGDMVKVEALQRALKINNPPKVIECFDISHLSGTSTTGSMIQFRNGKPDKSNYRRFKIRTVHGIDDVKAISEVILRRYRRLLEEKNQMPDLILIDGGKGQLGAGLDVLRGLGLQIPMISIAKKFEEIHLPGISGTLRLERKSVGLRYLQEIRDEAHRFAIKYNRLLRKKALREKK
ncbi:MAG: excinuclease ABC subunit UvrC [Nanoarchaeota archaeon]|nr:excinuclease ABC subunit UvrC [Nanoarchaeota archaeon]